jgi:TolB-like protein
LLIAGTAIGLAVRRQRPASGPIRSIAVLPLDNLSGDPGQDYLAAGMTDELTTMLAKNSTLHIVSRTSVMQYKGAHRPLPEIARELGVDGILEGSAARSGGRVHLTIQLIQASSDNHVWAESYSRDANDAFSLPLEAAETIAKQLHSTVLQPTSERFVRPEAHDAYLRGRYLWFRGQNEEAGKYFRKATELQPDYALGWSGLSIYYGLGSFGGELSPADSLVPLKATALKATSLDDQLPEAHFALGVAFFLSDWDWDKALQEVSRAIQLNPNYSEAYHFRGKILIALHRYDEAIAAQKKATELDPFARPNGVGRTFQIARQYDAAIGEVLQQLQVDANDPGLHDVLSYAYYGKGMKKEAMEEYAKELSLSGDEVSAGSVRRAYARGGWNAMLHWQLSQLERKPAGQYVSPVFLAYDYVQLGEKEKSLALLEEAYRQHAPTLLEIQEYPVFDTLHSEERYRSIIQRIGLPPVY